MSARLCKAGFASLSPFPPTNPTQTLSLCRTSRWFTGKSTWFHQGFPKFSRVSDAEMSTGHQKQVWWIILAIPTLGTQHWLNAQWMKDPIAVLGSGGFSWCWEERLHFQPSLTLVLSGQRQFPYCLAHSHCCFFKVRDLEAAGALITMSADTGVACMPQLLPGLFCKAFHLPEQCLSLSLLLLTRIVGT